MNRQHKAEIIQALHADFEGSAGAFVVGVQGLTVAQMQKLRAALRQQGGKLKVAKARLMKRAADDVAGPEHLKPSLKGQIGLVFAVKEAPAVAKVLHDFSKEHDSFKLIGGCIDTMMLDAASIERVATLPPKEVLLAQLCGTLKAPTTGLVYVLNALLVGPLVALKQLEEKKK
ncbi:MAG: 50S ribosomal protein L10 [Candidatus Babeliales bacterium]